MAVSGATTQSFNAMLERFVEELALTFPERGELAMYQKVLGGLTTTNPDKPLQVFMAAIGPHADKVTSRDPTFFDDCPTLFGSLDIASLWRMDMSEATRDAIWQYLQALLTLGTTVQAVPPEMLRSIETLAEKYVADVQEGRLDVASLMSQLMSGGGGLAELLGPAMGRLQ